MNALELRKAMKSKVTEPYRKQFQSTQAFLKTHTPAVRSSSSSHRGTSLTRTKSGPDVKREAVQLPKFSGKEPAAFVNYPVWAVNWEKLIQVYPEGTRAIMFLDHIDQLVKDKRVYTENDYNSAIGKIKSYYGNRVKVVECCLGEIAKCKPIKSDTYYHGLVNFCQILDTNYRRLVSNGSGHELSNTSHVNGLISKLPYQAKDRYMTYFMNNDEDERNNPLPIFMTWIEKEKAKWEVQEISSQSVSRGATAMFVQGASEPDSGVRGFRGDCFKCGKSGHMKRDCERDSYTKTGRGIKGKRRVKKSWCTFYCDPPYSSTVVLVPS